MTTIMENNSGWDAVAELVGVRTEFSRIRLRGLTVAIMSGPFALGPE